MRLRYTVSEDVQALFGEPPLLPGPFFEVAQGATANAMRRRCGLPLGEDHPFRPWAAVALMPGALPAGGPPRVPGAFCPSGPGTHARGGAESGSLCAVMRRADPVRLSRYQAGIKEDFA